MRRARILSLIGWVQLTAVHAASAQLDTPSQGPRSVIIQRVDSVSPIATAPSLVEPSPAFSEPIRAAATKPTSGPTTDTAASGSTPPSNTAGTNATGGTNPSAYFYIVPVIPPATVAPYDINSLGISFIQSSSGNWIYGEQNHFTARLNGKSIGDMESGKWVLKRTVALDLGARYSQDSSDFEPIRVSDNEFFAEAVVSYKAGWPLNPYASTSLRTPVTESFRYYNNVRQRTASFWDPVRTQQSVGFNFVKYTGFDYYSVRTGVAFYQTRARHHTFLTDDWYTFGLESFKSESGIENVSEINTTLDSAITLSGRLELFGTFKDLSIWTVNSRNNVRFKVWRFINATLAFDIIHDIRLSRRTQWRQSLMLGVVKDF